MMFILFGIFFGLFFSIIYSSLIFIGFLYYWKRKLLWSFDKVKELLTLEQISPRSQLLRCINLMHVDHILYFTPDEPYLGVYRVKIVLKNGKKITIYKSGFTKNNCGNILAKKISRFLHAPLFLKIDFHINFITVLPIIGFLIIGILMFFVGNNASGILFLLLACAFLPIFIGFFLKDYRKKGGRKFPIKNE